MITNNGVELLSKYLVGQATSYASYIAIGCGARPTSNNQGIIVTSAATVGTVSGSGPFTATLTSSSGWVYLEIGDTLTATLGSGTLGNGTVTVTGITSPTVITISSTASMTAGAVTNVKAYSSLTSQSLSTKSSLDFEIARFPISSRSYAVDKQIVSPTSLLITGLTSITATITSGHPFGVGDDVSISGVKVPSSGSVDGIDVNGLYSITAISSTSFTATPYFTPTIAWTSSMYGSSFTGESWNANLFYATAYTKQVSLTSEMSDITKYSISELGLYSLGSNQYSNSGNSRMLSSFSSSEGWTYYDGSTGFIDISNGLVSLPISSTPFVCSTSDSYWNDTYVTLRQEPPRIFEESIIVPGNLSNWTSGTTFTSNYLRLANPGINLLKAASSDEIRLAYSVINAVSTPTALPTALYIMFEFVCSDGLTTSKVLFSDSGTTTIYPNRYNVLVKKMSDFVSSSGFDWAKVTSVNVYCSIETASGTPTADYAIVLDGLRFENVGTENPLYALTAYTVVNNTEASMISKVANSNDLINFRLDLSVGK